jgi:serine protease Do
MAAQRGKQMTRNWLQRPRWFAPLLIVVALLVGAALGAWITRRSGTPVLISYAQAQNPPSGPVPTGFRSVVEKVAPAVVNVSTSRTVRMSQQLPPSIEDFFGRFFGDEFGPGLQIPRERRERSLGSGVIVSPDGYILTNSHVVEKADEVTVAMTGGKEFQAKVIGTDPMTDLAVLRVQQKNLPVITLGRSADVHVGDFALAVGNPFGLGQTVTQGIVSATGRGGLGIEEYEDFIQTDAAINPGNSGGALVNAQGALIGINTAILSGSGGFQGVGFAIPVDMAQNVMKQLIEHGSVTRGYIGAHVQEVTPEIAKSFGLQQPRGVLIGDVDPDGPGGKAGLQRGDILLTMNGKPVEDVRTLRLNIAQTPPGTAVKFTVWRNGKEIPITITLGKLPQQEQQAQGPGRQQEMPAMEGLQLQDLTPQIARELNLPPGTNGVVVSAVGPGSAAAEAGLRRGDVIQEVNRKPVNSVQEFEQAVRQAGNQPILLLVNSQGTTHFAILKPRR